MKFNNDLKINSIKIKLNKNESVKFYRLLSNFIFYS